MTKLKLLIIEDSEDAAILIVKEIERGAFEVELTRVEEADSLRKALKNDDLDLVISDYAIPGFTGLEALAIFKECGRDIPFIIVSGEIDEETAFAAMRAGAHDYVTKARLKRLVPAIERELAEARVRSERKSINERIQKLEKDQTEELRKSADRYELAEETSTDGLWEWEIETNEEYFSPRWLEIVGLKEDAEPTYSTWASRIHPDDLDRVTSALTRHLKDNEPYNIDYRHKHSSGVYYWQNSRGVAIRDNNGKPTRMVGFIRNISKEMEVIEELRKTAGRLATAQRVAHIGSWHLDLIKNNLIWTDENYRIFGIPKGTAMTYEKFLERVHPEDRDFVHKKWTAAIGGEPYDIEHRILIDNKVKWVREIAELVFDDKRKPVSGVGTAQDITEKKSTQEELGKLSTAIEQSVNVVIITDWSGRIEYVNPVFEQVTGYAKDEVIGRDPKILASGETPEALYKELWDTIRAGNTWRGEYKNKRKDGSFYRCNTVISPIKDDYGKITHFLGIQEDITERKSAAERAAFMQSKAEYLAAHDQLTGLANRKSFTNELDKLIKEYGKEEAAIALLIVNIDRFRPLNDTYGHKAGDAMLIQASSEIIKIAMEPYRTTRENESLRRAAVSRLGADEFGIILPGTDCDEAMAVAEKIRKRLDGFTTKDIGTKITASLGLSIFPKDGSSADELNIHADAALLRAKKLGGNRTHLFNPRDKELEEMRTRISDAELIQEALDNDRFEPFFQPIQSLSDDTIDHYECLARLRTKSGKILSPAAFIDAAEELNLIGAIDRVIIKKGIQKQASSRAKGASLSLAMNLSGKDLEDNTLIDFIKDEIKSSGADPASISFEITETEAIREIAVARDFIMALREFGCSFALDDFGVGFTSFVYLKELNVDYIKIDGYFIRELDSNPQDQSFVKAMTDIARSMKIKTIAEFVENKATLRLLKQLNVDFAQGYHIGKPAEKLLGHSLN